jgi:hypothetical protein
MEEIPLVVGVPDYDLPHSSRPASAIQSWIGVISKTGFEVCADVSERKKAPTIYYSWLAIEHNRTHQERSSVGDKSYLAAGHERSNGWVYDDNGDEEDMYIACKQIEFDRTYLSSPEVIVSSNHDLTSPHNLLNVQHQAAGKTVIADANAAYYRPVATYVTDITSKAFQVCSRVFFKGAATPPAGDKDLSWDWIAFPSQGVMKPNPTHVSVSESV